MSNGDIVLVMLCAAVILCLLAKWGWLPQSKSKDYLRKYYRGDDLRGEWWRGAA